MTTPIIQQDMIGTLVEGNAPVEATEPLIVPLIEGEELADETIPVQPATPTPEAPAGEQPLPSDVQERLQRATQLENQHRQRQEDQAIQGELQGIVEEATRRGMAQEDIDWFSKAQYTTVRRLLTNFERSQSEREYSWGQQLAAYKIAREKGVDPTLLLSAQDPQTMKQWADRELRYQDHEKRISTTEQSRVPPQPLNRTNTSRAGGQAVTADNIDALYTQGRVSAETYRRFLATGQIR
jgi:hypothetical protein